MDTPTPTREQVARALVRAATSDDFAAARLMHEAYLAAHPGDTDIRDLGELLTALPAALSDQEARAEEKADNARVGNGAA